MNKKICVYTDLTLALSRHYPGIFLGMRKENGKPQGPPGKWNQPNTKQRFFATLL